VVLQVKMVRIYAESLNLILTLTLAGFRRSFNSFKIRVKTLSTIGGIPLSLFIIRYDVFWVWVVSALLVGHSH
jgi:hypothetical protein